jgi:hypothetical protein
LSEIPAIGNKVDNLLPFPGFRQIAEKYVYGEKPLTLTID